MNAIELADMLEEEHYYAAALMMRQQQSEIETLRMHGYRTQYELLRIECIKQQTEMEIMKERNLFLESIYRTIKVQTR